MGGIMNKKTRYFLFATLLVSATTSAFALSAYSHNHIVTADTTATHAKNTNHISFQGNNYSTAFTANGHAIISRDIATLTPNLNYASGNTNLKTKIDMTESFTLKGKVNLGDKSKADGGADGVTFGFQPGDSSVIGGGGNGVGISGIQNAFAFKLDTYWNNASQFYSADPAEFEHSDNGNSSSFGAFVDGSTGVVNTIAEGAQAIEQPTDNQFKEVTINYDGNSKVMTATYEGKTWSQDVSSFIDINDRMSFFIAGSTGTAYNLQQFKLEQFDYTIAQGQVTAHYVDEQGNPLADDDIQSGDLETAWTTKQKEIPGYQLKKVQGISTGTFTADDQYVYYIYTEDQYIVPTEPLLPSNPNNAEENSHNIASTDDSSISIQTPSQSNVRIQYVNDETQTLLDTDWIKLPALHSYELPEKFFDGYILVSKTDNYAGIINTPNINIVFHYVPHTTSSPLDFVPKIIPSTSIDNRRVLQNIQAQHFQSHLLGSMLYNMSQNILFSNSRHPGI
jgi:hypothetical protein